jgi:hypothetical protein
MQTAVLIHGCHLQAENWEDIVWGTPGSGRLGRIPKGVLEALKFGAKTIIFSTGASQVGGVKEGEYAYHYARQHAHELAELAGMSEWRMRLLLLKRHVFELTSQDTRSEVLASARLARQRGAKRLVLVSSPTHIARCHQAAISVLGKEPAYRFFLENLYAVASDTCFKDSTVDDVVIIEPPHRGDMPKVPFYKTAKGIFPLMRKESVALQFNDAWQGLIEEFRKQL